MKKLALIAVVVVTVVAVSVLFGTEISVAARPPMGG